MTASYVPKRDEALFRRDGALLVPTAVTRGPWYDRTQHGSSMLAATAWAAEQHPSDVRRQVARLTVDMVRAAPIAPIRMATTLARAGKSMDIVEVTMHAGDELCVRGTALRFRTTDLEVDDTRGLPAPPPPTPPARDAGNLLPFSHPGVEEPGFHHAIDVHVDVEQAVAWFRLAVPVVEGEVASPFVALATAADWTYASPFLVRAAAGTAPPPEEQTVSAINADTTINVHRPMSGGWLGIQTTTHMGSLGAGASSARLYDELGAVGFSSQSLLLRGLSGAQPSIKEV